MHFYLHLDGSNKPIDWPTIYASARIDYSIYWAKYVREVACYWNNLLSDITQRVSLFWSNTTFTATFNFCACISSTPISITTTHKSSNAFCNSRYNARQSYLSTSPDHQFPHLLATSKPVGAPARYFRQIRYLPLPNAVPDLDKALSVACLDSSQDSTKSSASSVAPSRCG